MNFHSEGVEGTVLKIFVLILFNFASGYEDEEVSCPPGQAIATISRSSAVENKPITGSCRPLVSGTIKLKDSKCERRGVLQCNDQFEACDRGEWLGGILSYQLNSTRANLIIPICCSSNHVSVSNDSCQEIRVVEFLQPAKYRVVPGQLITGLKCQFISDQNKNVLDMKMQIKTCPYQVAFARPLPTGNVFRLAQNSSETVAVEPNQDETDTVPPDQATDNVSDDCQCEKCQTGTREKRSEETAGPNEAEVPNCLCKCDD